MTEAQKRANANYRIRNKEQIRERDRLIYQKRREKILKQKARHREENQDKFRDKEYRLRYGITLETYNKLFESQQGKCAICARHQTELKRTLCVDHNHTTGEVRGLLCHRCNTFIALADENPQALTNAIIYLKRTNVNGN